MLNDYTVSIIIKNRDLESISERTYSLTGYCQELKHNLAHVLNDIEQSFTDLQGGKQKEQWDEQTILAFQKIRKNLLNSANSIERLPKNIKHKGLRIDGIPAGEFVANILSNKTI